MPSGNKPLPELILTIYYDTIWHHQGVDSILRCHLTSIGNPIVEIGRSYNRLISTMGFPILVIWYLYTESGPRPQRVNSRSHPMWVSVYIVRPQTATLWKYMQCIPCRNHKETNPRTCHRKWYIIHYSPSCRASKIMTLSRADFIWWHVIISVSTDVLLL